jgi:hypothetical protein
MTLTNSVEAITVDRPRGGRRRLVGASVALVSLAFVACTPISGGGPTSAPPEAGSAMSATGAAAPAPLQDLHDVGQLQAALDQDAGKPRLLLLVSPT